MLTQCGLDRHVLVTIILDWRCLLREDAFVGVLPLILCLCAGVLALIDRNFQGFGKELFTDAGKYVIHFGSKPTEAAEQVSFDPLPLLC